MESLMATLTPFSSYHQLYSVALMMKIAFCGASASTNICLVVSNVHDLSSTVSTVSLPMSNVIVKVIKQAFVLSELVWLCGIICGSASSHSASNVTRNLSP